MPDSRCWVWIGVVMEHFIELSYVLLYKDTNDVQYCVCRFVDNVSTATGLSYYFYRLGSV